jgi:hypothetical protein
VAGRDLSRFGPAALAGLDEPVRRYFLHAIDDGAELGTGIRWTMTGRIRVGPWLPFRAEQDLDGRSLEWRARVGWGRFAPLSVVDSYSFEDGAGSTSGKLLGRTLFHAGDADTARSAAGRSALENALVPPYVLPDRGVAWRAESDEEIVATFDLPPEQPEVHVRIDAAGAVRSVSAQRWGNAGAEEFGYIPAGGEVHAERRFGSFVLPSEFTGSWWFGTPQEAPFFRATIGAAEVVRSA